MRNFFIAVFLSLVISVSAHAQKASEMANSFAEAFASKTMSSLDANRGSKGKIAVTIEHSMGGKRSVRSFARFSKFDEWLTSREHEDMPGRNANALKHCSKGVCTFDVSSLLHNNLYIKSINYGTAKGRTYITSVTLLDGD